MSRLLPALLLFTIAPGRLWAADPPLNGVRTTVAFAKQPACTASVSVATLGETFYTRSSDEFARQLSDLLSQCGVLPSLANDYLVVMFTANPTPGAGEPALLHAVFEKRSAQTGPMLANESQSLPGVAQATWIYLTDEEFDIPRTQLVSTRLDDPNLALLGPLAAAVAPAVPVVRKRLPPAPRLAAPVYVHLASVTLPFKRSTIAASDFIARPKRNDSGQLLNPENSAASSAADAAYERIEGTTTFSNTPRTWFTVNAGVAVRTGTFEGAERMRIDGDRYVSDPLSRVVTTAGVTLHLPFDGTRPEPTWREKLGVVVAAILTPAGGVAVGSSFGWRGVAIAATYGWIWVDTAPEGSTAGDAAQGQPQLVTGRSRGFLVGGIYTFGG